MNESILSSTQSVPFGTLVVGPFSLICWLLFSWFRWDAKMPFTFSISMPNRIAEIYNTWQQYLAATVLSHLRLHYCQTVDRQLPSFIGAFDDN
jgi:hypothetical protein